MSKKTLLLNASYEILSFIPERKVFKLLFKDKVEVISSWDDYITWGSGKVKHPSILRLKNHVKRNYFNSNFSRKALVKRDRSMCQYCAKKLPASQITVDHVLPRAQKGTTSFTNCVVCCHSCNNKKADRTPEQAGMVLLRKPTHPSFTTSNYIADPQEHWFNGWNDFLSS
jgi:hypothetical protein